MEAVLVVLPPQAQSAVIQAALRQGARFRCCPFFSHIALQAHARPHLLPAGKHVLSEKPAAPALAQAEQLLAFHASLPQPAPLWYVAENYRSMGAFQRMRDCIRSGALGTIARLDMAVDLGACFVHFSLEQSGSSMALQQ